MKLKDLSGLRWGSIDLTSYDNDYIEQTEDMGMFLLEGKTQDFYVKFKACFNHNSNINLK